MFFWSLQKERIDHTPKEVASTVITNNPTGGVPLIFAICMNPLMPIITKKMPPRAYEIIRKLLMKSNFSIDLLLMQCTINKFPSNAEKSLYNHVTSRQVYL